ncbi:cytochrome c oxidase assembly protein [Mycolicibacterium komossense]|uniref:Cytochrome c oxidase assembly protein n=1 Tax=Mycolicibacterium komossense TaxID=1779 RepID=A0ABT3CG50_9MYCO|nr:cytochrome c oxidase assembly protein [Mycolicibacterium komossense]MCV7228460.1 cytochrome c oxidase assembly protein [Mycolicibacterium komossense]
MTDTAAVVAPPAAPSKAITAALLAAGGAVLAALTVYVVVSGDSKYLETGDSPAGLTTSALMQAGTFLGTLCGGLCLGAIVYILVGARPDSRGLIDAGVFRVHVLAERAAAAWAVCAMAMVVVSAADDAGVSVIRLITSSAIPDAVAADQRAAAWIVTAFCGLLVALFLRWSLLWITHAVLVLPAATAVMAVPVTGNAATGPNHDYATGAVIMFAIAAAVLLGTKVAASLSQGDRRLRIVMVIAGGVALGYGMPLLGLLVPARYVLTTAYGRWGVIAAVLLFAVFISDAVALHRQRRNGRAYQRVDLAGALAMIAVVGATSAMAVRTAPALLAHRFTSWDVYLGYELPDPPNFVTLLSMWRWDIVIGAAAVFAAAAYLIAVIGLRRRGDAWPPGRTVAWLIGCAALLFVSSSGVKAYGSAMFSVHMGEHMALNMFIPVVLVLGAPATLALRILPAAPAGSRPGPREWLLTVLQSKFTGFFAHPATAFVIFVGSLYLVYFTPLFGTLARYHWGHELMSAHFLITGYLFYWGIIGIDPGPRRLPFLARLGLLFAVMPFHAFFGIATMSMTSIIGKTFYGHLGLPWLESLTRDQWLGGAIAWGAGEVPVLIVVVALITQWARQDRRDSARVDRQSDTYHNDDDLEAYNAMLRELSRTRR